MYYSSVMIFKCQRDALLIATHNRYRGAVDEKMNQSLSHLSMLSCSGVSRGTPSLRTYDVVRMRTRNTPSCDVPNKVCNFRALVSRVSLLCVRTHSLTKDRESRQTT